MLRRSGLTLAEYCRDYCAARIGTRAEYHRQLAIAVALWDRWRGSPVTLAAMHERELRGFLAAYSQQVSGATVNAKRRFLLALWHAAAADGLAPEPTTKIPRAKERPPVPEAWTREELSRVTRSASAEAGSIAGLPAAGWWLSLILTAYDTGERISALRAVAYTDPDLARGGLWIRRSGKDAPHWHPLAPQTIDVLSTISLPERSLLWPWPYSREWLDERFRRILRRAGVRYGRGAGGCWHKLRRTSGTLVEAAGGDGSRHIGNTRAVFERHYLDRRLLGRGQVDLLPRPTF